MAPQVFIEFWNEAKEVMEASDAADTDDDLEALYIKTADFIVVNT